MRRRTALAAFGAGGWHVGGLAVGIGGGGSAVAAAGQGGDAPQPRQPMEPMEPSQPAASSQRSLPSLRKGVNLTHWFEYERGQPVSDAEMRQLRAAGFDHVRIPIDPVLGGWSPVRGGALAITADLQRAAGAALDAGLDVVIDLHLTPADKQRIEDDADAERPLVALWRQLADAFANTPADRVAFELFNEPQYYGLQGGRWPVLQRKLLAAVRVSAPSHLVLLTGARGGSVQALAALRPEPDARTAWVFHLYDPFLFTHQGASWLDERYTTAGLRSNLRYPPAAQAGVTPGLAHPHPRAASDLAEYLQAGWGVQRLRALLAPAATWARRHGVRVLCNEFGVIRAGVDPASRYRWLADVRSALEADGIGWTVWDYTDIFGITAESTQPGRSGRRTLEAAAFGALGLAGAPAGAAARAVLR